MPNPEPTVMRAALERAGLTPRMQSVDARHGERSAVVFVDPSQLSDKQIIEEMSTLRVESADIMRQLDDDKDAGLTRTGVWRAAARRARRSKLLRLDQLAEEARRRGLIAAVPELAAQAAKRANTEAQLAAAKNIAAIKLERTQTHEAAIRAAAEAKTARIMERAEKNRTQCELFVKAAYQLHSRDVCDQIWKRAREMFADDPGWINPPDQSPPTLPAKTP